MRFLTNQEKFKTVLLNGYLQKRQSVVDVTREEKLLERNNIGKCLKNRMVDSEDHLLNQPPIYDKKVFYPFKEERDHLGRLIDSVSLLYLFHLFSSYFYCNWICSHKNCFVNRKYGRRQERANYEKMSRSPTLRAKWSWPSRRMCPIGGSRTQSNFLIRPFTRWMPGSRSRK